jgi:hypothetical protein
MSGQGGEPGSLPWADGSTRRNGLPAGKPYVWRRDERQLVACPDHPGKFLCLLAGGAVRGTCPVDGRSYQIDRDGARP